MQALPLAGTLSAFRSARPRDGTEAGGGDGPKSPMLWQPAAVPFMARDRHRQAVVNVVDGPAPGVWGTRGLQTIGRREAVALATQSEP